jgi:small-conductance mechanosensitive channel
MDTTNQMTNQMTAIGKLYSHFSNHTSSPERRLALIIVMVIAVHLMVKGTRLLSEWLINRGRARKGLEFVTHQPKFVTLIQLVANSVTFFLYFIAVGLVLEEYGVDLTKYLASASILGLAISFGSQGLVQDVVISLTLIFSDVMDTGDLVDVLAGNSVIGHVEEIGLRFTIVRNFYNQAVYIPNRTIANVSRFPYGGIYAYADVQLPADVARDAALQLVKNAAQGMWVQFGAIILDEPGIGPVEEAPGHSWNFVRVQFKIWPGQGALIENTFRQQVVSSLKTLKADYADWQVPVTYRTISTWRKL